MPKKVNTKARKTRKVKLPSVVRNIEPVEDLNENHVALFYGKAGRGKTRTAATFPTPNLFIDINNEKGLKTIKTVKGIEVARVTDWEEFLDLYWWLREGQKYKTVTLDQITGLQDVCSREAREHFRLEEGEQLRGWNKIGRVTGNLKTWLANYRELSDLYNIVFLAHERAFESDSDDEDGEIDPSVSARLMPSIGSFIDGACDIIGQSFIRSIKEKKKDPKTGKFASRIEYALRIGPHPTYVTKIRRPPEAGRIPDFIIDPTYQKLVAIESGEIIRSTAKRRKVNGKKQKG